jgi:TonB family protein
MKIGAVQWASILSFTVVSCTTTLPVAPTPPIPERETSGCVPMLQAMKTVNPQWPRNAYEAGQEGWVQVLFDIEPSGTPANIRVLASSPPGVFESAVTVPLAKVRFPGPGRNCYLLTQFKLK